MSQEAIKTDSNHNLSDDRTDMQKWISHRNIYIPMSEMEFIIGIPPFDFNEEDHTWIDDKWLKGE